LANGSLCLTFADRLTKPLTSNRRDNLYPGNLGDIKQIFCAFGKRRNIYNSSCDLENMRVVN
jgi:hypothetical protein